MNSGTGSRLDTCSLSLHLGGGGVFGMILIKVYLIVMIL